MCFLWWVVFHIWLSRSHRTWNRMNENETCKRITNKERKGVKRVEMDTQYKRIDNPGARHLYWLPSNRSLQVWRKVQVQARRVGYSTSDSLQRLTEETQALMNGLLKAKCQEAMRDQSSHLREYESRDRLLHSISSKLNDPQLTYSLFSPSLLNYTRYFVKRKEGERTVDQYVLMNSNGICVLGLAETNDFVRNHKQVQSIEFGVSTCCSMWIEGNASA